MLFNGTRNFIMGFALGFGTGLITREIAPHVKQVLRPGLKSIIKLSIQGFEKMKEGFFRFGEVMEDLTEEVKVELKEKPYKKKKAKRPRVVTPIVRTVETEMATETPLRKPA